MYPLGMYPQDRSLWKLSTKGLEVFEHQRAEASHASKACQEQSSSAEALFLCSTCGRSCASRIGLFSHLRCTLMTSIHKLFFPYSSIGSTGDSIIIIITTHSLTGIWYIITGLDICLIVLFCFVFFFRKTRSVLVQGANPNLLLPDGISPFHLAVGIESEDALEFVKVMLQYGANPNIR